MNTSANSAAADPSAPCRLQWLGDISLDGIYCDPQHHQALRENMTKVAQELGPADLRVGNWESPLWGDGGTNLLKRPRVNTTADAAECLVPLKLDVAMLGNNHAYDCLEPGFANTLAFLKKHNIATFGAGFTPADAAKPILLKRKNLSFALLNYVGLETNPNLPPNSGVKLNVLEPDRVEKEVRELAAQGNIVLVHFHWGVMELVRYPMPWQRTLARRLIDAGAKVIIGGHAHCVHGDEEYNGGHIFYSMGNFLFSRLPVGPGYTGYDWPVISRNIGVAQCDFGPDGRLLRSGWHFFFQNDLLLRADNTPKRQKLQSKLSRPLKASDRVLARTYKREVLAQKIFWPGLAYIKKSGGLIGALLGIRMRHFTGILKGVKSSRGKC